MRTVLGQTLRNIGLNEGAIHDLLLAVTEACTNVLKHSGSGRGYDVVGRVGQDSCFLEVIDNGRGFDPLLLQPARRVAGTMLRLVPAPRSPLGRTRLSRARLRGPQRLIARLPESGRGLTIMQAFVDEVKVQSRPGRGTVVALTKHIELPGGAPLARPSVPLRDAG